MYTFKEVLSIVNTEIEEINWKRVPTGLYEPIEYILSMGGKRLRPAIALMSYNLYADDIMSAVKPALGLEVFHNFTLLHDDIMDHADMRRGKPTVHKKWDDNTAILSGDVMQIEGFKLIAGTPVEHLKVVLDLFSKTATEICEGQQLDMEFESREDVTVEEYLEMVRLKTAVLLATGAQIGAILGGSSDSDAEFLYQFGNSIGLAFQLKDDYLDVYGNTQEFQKKLGGDIVVNKKTFMLINACQLASPAQKAEIDQWIQAKTFDADEKIAAITHIYNILGIDKLAQQKIEKLFAISLQSLDKVKVADEKKAELRLFANKLMGRKY